MKKVFVAVVVLSLSSLLLSCGGKGAVPPTVDFAYQKGAIVLHLKADPRLNLYQRSPHTLSLCIYQLRDPNGFNQLAGDQAGLYKLLECSRFDGTVAMATRLDVQPGTESTQALDRAEGVRGRGGRLLRPEQGQDPASLQGSHRHGTQVALLWHSH
jgi:predicted component of type VI protein secretion system